MSTHKPGTLVPERLDSNQIPIFSNYLSASQKYGLKIEQWLIEELEKRGYSPKVPTNFAQTACDAYVNGLCIEIKAAKRTRRFKKLASGEVKAYYRWQWNIHPTHKGEYALILVADTPQKKRFCFILPGSVVGTRTHLQITSHPIKYTGWMSAYLEKWDVIDYLAREVYKGYGPLFQQWEGSQAREAA